MDIFIRSTKVVYSSQFKRGTTNKELSKLLLRQQCVLFGQNMIGNKQWYCQIFEWNSIQCRGTFLWLFACLLVFLYASHDCPGLWLYSAHCCWLMFGFSYRDTLLPSPYQRKTDRADLDFISHIYTPLFKSAPPLKQSPKAWKSQWTDRQPTDYRKVSRHRFNSIRFDLISFDFISFRFLMNLPVTSSFLQ